MRLILLGPPGAGNGTQAARITQELRLAHVASGDLFRQAQQSGTELGLLAKSYMERGELVPDEVTVRMVLERIAAPDCSRGFLLDGFPRTMAQAQALDKALGRQGIDKVVYIKVSQEELVRRLEGRLICKVCQAPYHLVSAPPKVPGKCDRCGGELYQRADDTPEAVKKRVQVYLTDTAPLVKYYQRAGKLVEVDGQQSVEEVGNVILSALTSGTEKGAAKRGAWGVADTPPGEETKRRPVAIILKSQKELALMREAGKVVAETIQILVKALRPGLKTAEMDTMAEEHIKSRGAIPSFKGYRGYPATICVSIDEQIVHGIPSQRVIQEGNIVSLDVGAIYKGYQADAAVTAGAGNISPEAQRLIESTRGALEAGIKETRAGARLGDVSSAIQEYAESRGYSVVREYVGHGIGRNLHEDPPVPNYGLRGRGPLLVKGMTIAIEPMINIGTWKTRVLEDNWTVVTEDSSLSAHFEHTIAITDGEPLVLTRLED